jgi:hypothetical protein
LLTTVCRDFRYAMARGDCNHAAKKAGTAVSDLHFVLRE